MGRWWNSKSMVLKLYISTYVARLRLAQQRATASLQMYFCHPWSTSDNFLWWIFLGGAGQGRDRHILSGNIILDVDTEPFKSNMHKSKKLCLLNWCTSVAQGWMDIYLGTLAVWLQLRGSFRGVQTLNFWGGPNLHPSIREFFFSDRLIRISRKIYNPRFKFIAVSLPLLTL